MFLVHDPDEVGLQVPRGGVAVVAVERERLGDHGPEGRGDARVDARRSGVLPVEDELEGIRVVGTTEKAAPGAELEEDDAQGEDVAARVKRLAARLLRGHVRQLALHLAGTRVGQRPGGDDAGDEAGVTADARVGIVGQPGLGDAEINDLHIAGEGHENVLRRDVPVHDREGHPVEVSLFVRVGEARGSADADGEGMLQGEVPHVLRAHRAHDRAKVFPVDVLHRDEVLALGLADVERRHDVGVRESRRDARLLQQHRDERLVAPELRQDALDDHEALEVGERPRKRSLGPAIAIAAVLIGGAIAFAFALGSKSNSGHETPPVVRPTVVAPVRPVVPSPTRPLVAPPAVNPAVVAPHPVAPAHTLVTLQVVTTPPGTQVRGEPIEGNGVTFTCTTPCTEHVPSHVSMRLTAQRPGRRGTIVVTPVEAMAPVDIPLELTRARPTPFSPPSPNPPASPRRCGATDPDTGLLIPCFNHGSGGAH